MYLLVLQGLLYMISGQETTIFFLCELIASIILVFLVGKVLHYKFINQLFRLTISLVLPFVLIIFLISSVAYSAFLNSEVDKISYGDTTYFYRKDDIDMTLDDLGVNKPNNYLYEETIHAKANSFLGMREEYSDYCYSGDDSYGYTLSIFSSKFQSIMDKYNKLASKDENYIFTRLTSTESEWGSNQVLYGKSDFDSMYVVVGDGNTLVIFGDLSPLQAAKLSSYYINR